MQHSVIAALMLVIAAVLIAGCTQGTAPAVTSAPTAVTAETAAAAAATTTIPQVSFTLGDHYLGDPGGYQLLTEKDTVVKEFRVDNDSWGIYFKVLPLNDDLQSCWFRLDTTDVNSNKSDSYGYGRQYSFEKEQWIPMYKQGSYKLSMTGNNVKVWVTAAKRNP
jgi:hypothetical protein